MADYTIKGVLFDFDGTLTQPGVLDFDRIKDAIGCPHHQPMLEYIQGLASDAEQRSALAKLEQFEAQGAANSRPNADAEEVVAWVRSLRLPVGIITRNSRASVLQALENFGRLAAQDFDLIITRDDPLAVKPSGEGIVWAARQWRLSTSQMVIVGDYIFDPQAGQAAGALTVLLDPHDNPRLADTACHFRITGLADLPPILMAGLAQPSG